ncbi:MAG: transketolase-like TK C-terminal-containing protein, partial [Acidimicrobiia bacterium]
LQGEGLQHDDGHSPVLASTVPNCRVYDPAFAYELAVIIEDGVTRMYGEKPEDCFYYITLYNETITMPAMPEGSEEGILRGLYRHLPAPEGDATYRARILASGSAMQAACEARDLLMEHHDTAAEVWSATSYKALREDALAAERWNRLHPTEAPRVPWVSHTLGSNGGPVVAVTDYMKVVPEQIARWAPGPFLPLGTDGYGFSDTRSALRRHFETDAAHVVVAVLHGLAQQGEVKGEVVAEAIRRYEIDADAVDPREA